MPHVNESCPSYERVMSHIWTNHVAPMDDMPHKWMSHVTNPNDACHTHECIMSHVRMSHVTYCLVCVCVRVCVCARVSVGLCVAMGMAEAVVVAVAASLTNCPHSWKFGAFLSLGHQWPRETKKFPLSTDKGRVPLATRNALWLLLWVSLCLCLCLCLHLRLRLHLRFYLCSCLCIYFGLCLCV